MSQPRYRTRDPHDDRPRRADRLARAGARVLCLVALCAGAASAADRKVEFNRDIRPILSENCFACHGPDSAARKADLRLDRREAAVDAGVIAPGDPEGSELIARITEADQTQMMPPPKSTKKLTG